MAAPRTNQPRMMMIITAASATATAAGLLLLLLGSLSETTYLTVLEIMYYP